MPPVRFVRSAAGECPFFEELISRNFRQEVRRNSEAGFMTGHEVNLERYGTHAADCTPPGLVDLKQKSTSSRGVWPMAEHRWLGCETYV